MIYSNIDRIHKYIAFLSNSDFIFGKSNRKLTDENEPSRRTNGMFSYHNRQNQWLI